MATPKSKNVVFNVFLKLNKSLNIHL